MSYFGGESANKFGGKSVSLEVLNFINEIAEIVTQTEQPILPYM